MLTLHVTGKLVHRGSGKRKLIYLRLGKPDYVSLGSTVKGSPVEDKTERPEDPAPARSRSNHIVAPFQVGVGTSDASWHVQLRLKRTVHVTDRLHMSALCSDCVVYLDEQDVELSNYIIWQSVTIMVGVSDSLTH